MPRTTALPLRTRAVARLHGLQRVLLSHYVLNGLSCALGLLLIAAGLHLGLGALAGSAATVGAIVAIPPDGVAPQRGKFWHLLPAPLLGMPLFLAVQLLLDRPALLGLLVYAGAIAVGLLLLYLVIRAGVAAGIIRASRNGHLLHPTHPDRASHPPAESRSIG